MTRAEATMDAASDGRPSMVRPATVLRRTLAWVTVTLVVVVTAACGAPAEDGDEPVAVVTPTPATARDDRATEPAPTPEASEAAEVDPYGDLPDGHETSVVRIVDGDTIVVGGGERIRLIGIDTPETVHPRRPVECFGREATRHITELIPPGTDVVLEFDVERTDQYGRTLAYVWRAQDALHVNLAMVADGYAQVVTYPPNVAHTDAFVAAQREARENGRGLWSACRDD